MSSVCGSAVKINHSDYVSCTRPNLECGCAIPCDCLPTVIKGNPIDLLSTPVGIIMHDQSNGSETIHPDTTCVLPLGKPKAILHGFRKTFIATPRISVDSSAQNTHRPVSVFASPRSLYSTTDRAGRVSPRNVRGFPYKVMFRS